MRPSTVVRGTACCALLLLVSGAATMPSPESIAPNDNRLAAGTLQNGVLTVSLEARVGAWKPDGESGKTLEVAAFSETGQPLSVPGPVIRIPVGTVVRATIRNTLDKPLTVYGLGSTRGMTSDIVVPVNGENIATFTATTAGTFFYAANRGGQDEADLQLHGAIVVDPPNARTTNDRILLISWWLRVDPASPNGLDQGTMVINGLSWPNTERLDYAEGDSIHWRIINMTGIDHPMHLHGFYFRLDARGDGVSDSTYAYDQRRMAVTEVVEPMHTMALSWKAERPGNWVFHCHYALHVSPIVSLDMKQGVMASPMAGHELSGGPHQMFGLVMGIRVAANGPRPALTGRPRAVRITMREQQNFYGDKPGFAFVLGGTPAESDPQAMPIPGMPLVLERGRPVSITVVNRANEAASIHWHGIELESFPDGVPGWSGSGTSVLPAVKPNDSLTVTFTPPRVGSFMYHSHINEWSQMAGGAYGPIIVVEPGQRLDTAVDKLWFFGTAALPVNPIFGAFPAHLMNGENQPAPMDLTVGVKYRFRLFNLAGDTPTLVTLTAGDTPVTWKAVAKDGYTLPPAQVRTMPAKLVFDPGEIYDFEYTPTAPGDLTLTFGMLPPPPNAPPPPPGFPPLPPMGKMVVRVR